MRTANPALNAKTFTELARVADTARAMTINGTINKTALLAALTLIPATYTWRMYYTAWDPSAVVPWIIGGAIGGFVVALITIFKKQWVAFTAPSMPCFKGCFSGVFPPFSRPNILESSFKP